MSSLLRLFWLLVWLGLALYLALTLWLGVVGLVYPYQLDYGEGIVLWFAQQLAHGQTIYKGLTGFPYASSNYPPVAMLLSAALMPIFGDGYVAGRLLNFAAALIVAALIYRIILVETRDRRSAAIAALIFIGSPYVYNWVPSFRVDLIGLAFAFGGVYAVWLWERQQPTVTIPRSSLSTVYCLLFTVLFLLALYTKQTLFAAPAAAFLALFLRDKRTAIVFALVLGALGGTIYLAIDYATGGGFTFGLIESNATVFLPEQLILLLRNFAATFPILLLLALWAWVRRVRARYLGVLELYGAISIAVLVMAGRAGAWENYFFEAIAIACVFAGVAVASQQSPVNSPRAIRNSQFSNFQPPTSNFRFLLPVLLLAQVLLMWHDPRVVVNLIAEELPANQQLAALLKRTPGTIISEDMGALATSGKEVAYYTFQYSLLARSAKWNQSWELNGLRDGAFPLVILERGTREDVDHYRRFTRDFVSTLDRYYARTQTIGKYQVYAPALPLRLQSADFGDAIALVGWNTQPETLKPGTLKLEVVWQAKRAVDRRCTAFVHLEKVDGGKVTQDDREPHGGIYPTTRWAANEMVREEYALNVPGDLSPGKYVLKVGWYDSDTGDRLTVPGSVDDTVALETYEMK